MSYNGSGTFNINSTGQPVVAGTVITASAFNALTTDLATGLTTAITKDGQTTTTARITFAQGITSSLTTDSSSVSTGSIITAGGAGIAKNLYVGSAVKFVGATSGSVGLQAKAVAGSTTFNLPSADGTSNQAMVTDGSGNLSFATIAATPGGSTTQVQYNSSGAFAGSANMTFSGTALTLANDASISGLTVGKGGGAVSTNTAVGGSVLQANTSGAYNTIVGYQAGYSNTTGSTNVAIGRTSFYNNTTGSDNTAVGHESGFSNTTGASNTALGQQALRSNTTASNNTAVGYQAGYSNNQSNTTAVGYKAGYANTGDNELVAVGYQALTAATTGTSNTSVGHNSSSSITTGGNNTVLGSAALMGVTTTSNNTAIGRQALNASTASNCTAIGYQAGISNTTGNGGIFIGQGAGTTRATTGDFNILIGATAQNSATGGSYEIVIGTNNPTGKGGSTGFINAGGGGVYQGNNSATWSVTSDQRLKKNIVDNTDGLDIISQIRVRNFEYRTAEEVTELPSDQAVQKQGIQLGVIAQELLEVCGDCVKEESTGVMSVNSDNLTWHMINAIKDLKALVDAQATEITALKAKVGI